MLFSRPRAPIEELVSAPATPMPAVRTNLRRVSMRLLLIRPYRLPAVVVAGRSTLRNTADGLLHLVHRPDRDARVGLLERREVAPDHDPLLGAGVAEVRGRPADVDEEEVALRVGRLAAQVARAP